MRDVVFLVPWTTVDGVQKDWTVRPLVSNSTPTHLGHYCTAGMSSHWSRPGPSKLTFAAMRSCIPGSNRCGVGWNKLCRMRARHDMLTHQDDFLEIIWLDQTLLKHLDPIGIHVADLPPDLLIIFIGIVCCGGHHY